MLRLVIGAMQRHKHRVFCLFFFSEHTPHYHLRDMRDTHWFTQPWFLSRHSPRELPHGHVSYSAFSFITLHISAASNPLSSLYPNLHLRVEVTRNSLGSFCFFLFFVACLLRTVTHHLDDEAWVRFRTRADVRLITGRKQEKIHFCAANHLTGEWILMAAWSRF